METNQPPSSERTIKYNYNYNKPLFECVHELGSAKSTFSLRLSTVDTLIVNIKEDKKHLTYSLDSAEEKALYEFLKARHGFNQS